MPDKTIQGTINITNVNVTNSLTENGKKVLQFIETTYADLVTLRNNNQLVAGCKYRITDFVTTTAQANTLSANHAFDIVVTALTSSQLSENAEALLHEGDTYFANSKLSAWELKYCLDNDTSRFAWADTVNGKGVIYHMKDEHHNSCAYDFKNIRFKTNKRMYVTVNDIYNIQNIYTTYFELDETQNVNNLYAWRADYQLNSLKPKLVFTDTKTPTTSSTLYNADGTVMSDVTLKSVDEYSERIFYTFAHHSLDDSMYEKCYDNIICEYYVDNILTLNFTIFNVQSVPDCYMNRIDVGNNHNLFEYSTYKNVIGTDCCANDIKYAFNQNIIANNFCNNQINNGCHDNIINNDFRSNVIANSMTNNVIGSSFINNNIKTGMMFNTIGFNFYNNTIGVYFAENEVGCEVGKNIIGNHFRYNNIGQNFYNNVIGNTTDDLYMRSCKFDENINNIKITCDDTDASNSNQIQYIHVCRGVRGSGSTITINVPDRNLNYEITYQKTNSQIINI